MKDIHVVINHCEHKTFLNVLQNVCGLLRRINSRRTAIGMLIQSTIVDLEPFIYFLEDVMKQSEHRDSEPF